MVHKSLYAPRRKYWRRLRGTSHTAEVDAVAGLHGGPIWSGEVTCKICRITVIIQREELLLCMSVEGPLG